MGKHDRKTRREDRTAYWIAKLRAGPLTDPDRRRFEAWRAAHPANHAAVEDLLRIHRRGPGARRGGAAVPAPSSRRAKPSKPKITARRWPSPRALLAVALVAAVAAAYLTREEAADYRTAPGAQGSFALVDGSVVFMNTDTAIDVSENGIRRLHLLEGEADIILADDGVPIEVRVAGAELRTARGRFLLRKDAGAVTLAVIDGTVAVRRKNGGPLVAQIAAGEVVTLSEDGSAAFPSALAIEDLAAWQEGAVVFDATPLDQALCQLSRYRDSRLIILAGRLAGRAVAGRYSLQDPGALMARLVREGGAEKLEILGLYTLVY